MLEFHALYAELLSDALIEKAQGKDDKATELYVKLRDEVGKYELAFERWYDQGMFFFELDRYFRLKTVLSEHEEIDTV